MLSIGSSYPRESAGDEEETTATPEGAFDTVGIQMSGTGARLLFGRAPYAPRVTVPLSRVAVSGDIGDLVGYLNTPGATVSTLLSDNASVSNLQSTILTAGQIAAQAANVVTLMSNDATVDQLSAGSLTSDNANIVTLASNNAIINEIAANYVNATGADVVNLQNQSIDTESLSTGGTQVFCDWNNTAGTQLPSIALLNNPLVNGYNSDRSKGGYQLGQMLIGLGEAAGTEALLYFAKQGGGWLMSLGSDALSLFSGYCSLSEAGLSLGADAAGAGAALGGDLASFVAGSEGLVMAESAGEAAAMFSSAGVLSELGTGFATEAGEAGEALLAGIESSTAEFEEVAATPGLIQNITGSARWVAFA